MRTKLTITLLLLGLGLAGCGRGTVTSSGTAPSGDEPWGRTFLSTSVTENGQPKPLVGGTRISLRFTGSSSDGERREIGAQAGCNSMGGPASIEDGQLVVGDLATTEMGCDPPRHAQDEWLARFLTSRPTWSLQGSTLTLESGATRIVLEDRKEADPDRALRGTKWVVDTIIEGEAASSVPAGADAHVIFGDGADAGRFTGNSGCNGMGGSSAVDEGASTIAFAEVITTKMACEDDRMRLEQAVLDTLDGTVTYKVDADVLTLDHPDGHGLRLRAAAS